ncbi:potassium channel family protein [Allorhodopirellula heiligendammensis]|uniref:Ktr system potassium uptake protein A n=1 Tax=Allorhodopirellula heiligendammensis TaxID=2714739 RepID=A0A5C6BZG7_9BACT|nr:TrkA family potassium uptake protein [Allorhodopirellula heiligendammensis]TWU16009.1 Ktr system potassium uptake protein A [Allorhodopirellula heiligendammensis]
MKRYVVIGLGNFGASVAEALSANGAEVIAVDMDGDAVDRNAVFVAKAAVGNGTDLATLERLGVRGVDGAVISTGDDITASILTSMALRDLRVSQVYVKVNSRDHARVMERIGVTEIVFPERESAISLGKRMCGKAVLNHVRLATGFSIQEMAVPEIWQGFSLRELKLRQKYEITVVALHDILRDTIAATPDPDTQLKDSDTLMVAGSDEMLARVAALR